jgi:hypothetical protein
VLRITIELKTATKDVCVSRMDKVSQTLFLIPNGSGRAPTDHKKENKKKIKRKQQAASHDEPIAIRLLQLTINGALHRDKSAATIVVGQVFTSLMVTRESGRRLVCLWLYSSANGATSVGKFNSLDRRLVARNTYCTILLDLDAL